MKIVSLSIVVFLLRESICDVPLDLNRLDPIEVSALGRVAKLGEFYDVRTEQFLHLSIFKNQLDEKFVEVMQNRETQVFFTLDSSLENKFRIMDISEELQLSIVSELVQLKGSGKYFKGTRTRAKMSQAYLIQTFSSVNEQVSLLASDLQTNIKLHILPKIDATHVVVGIQWGGSVYISVEDPNEGGEEIGLVDEELRSTMKLMELALSSVDVEKVNLTQKDLEKYSFAIDGDVVPQTVPQTILEALEFMKQSPESLLEANDGKGKPIKYFLMPLKALQKYWDILEESSHTVYPVNSTIILESVLLFDEIDAIQQRIGDVKAGVLKYQKYFPDKKIQELKEIKDKVNNLRTRFVENLSKHVVQVRAGEQKSFILDDDLYEAKKQRRRWPRENEGVLVSRVKELFFLKAMEQQLVFILDRDTPLDSFLWENFNVDIYILFYNFADDILYKEALCAFKILLDKKDPNSSDLYIAVNYELVAGDKIVDGWEKVSKICIFRNAKLIFDNYPLGPSNNATDPDIWFAKPIVERIEKNEELIVKLNKRLDNVEDSPELKELRKDVENIVGMMEKLAEVIDNSTEVQKNQIDAVNLSLEEIEEHLKWLDKLYREQKTSIEDLGMSTLQMHKTIEENPGIPVGFIYIQFPQQPRPSELFPGIEWIDISLKYGGLFFRCDGGEAAPFGETQIGSAPSNQIFKYQISAGGNETHAKGPVNLQPNGWSDCIHLGRQSDEDDEHNSLRFYSETKFGEVRPHNTAIRIWMRDALVDKN